MDNLDRILDSETQPEIKVHSEDSESFLENCCHDPEYCVSASCLICPNCREADSTRTTPPDEENVSEFICNFCGEYFTAINP